MDLISSILCLKITNLSELAQSKVAPTRFSSKYWEES